MGIAHWDEVGKRSRELGHLQGTWTFLGEAAGCVNVKLIERLWTPGTLIHEMGTARMGRDPATSVLNGWCQAHDVPNLFVTDGSCMASTAVQNPSLTYMALSARAANHAANLLKEGVL